MSAIVLAMPGNEASTDALAASPGMERGEVLVRRFPDGESHVQIRCDVRGRDVVIVCTLDRPDAKLVPLLLLVAAAREGGARSVGLLAPYLAYMRQDVVFEPGETISARHFASWISGAFDWLVTVDPHLHRIASLSEVYSISTTVVRAADSIAAWVKTNVAQPLLVGPDEESTQWVADVARRAGAPFIVLQKMRRGDRDVEVSIPHVGQWGSHTPVLVDDIASTAHTMMETVRHLRSAGLAPPVCIAVHPIFADTAYEELRAAGAADIVSCNTILHPSNRIALNAALAAAVAAHLGSLQTS